MTVWTQGEKEPPHPLLGVHCINSLEPVGLIRLEKQMSGVLSIKVALKLR